MSNTRVEFPNKQGQLLSGLLELPNFGQPIAYILMAHSFGQTKRTKAGTYIARALRKEGFAVLRFDFSGLGQSAGDFANTNFTTNVNDILSAVSFLRENYAAPQILIGHSLGGTAVIEAANDVPECVAVSTIGSPSDPVHVTHLFSDQLENIMENGCAEVVLGGKDITIKKQFVDDLKGQCVKDSLHQLNRAFLAFHSPFDEIVDIEEAKSLYQAALHPKSFVSLDHANHMLTDSRDAEYVGSVLAAWALRYLKQEQQSNESDISFELKKGEVSALIETQKYLTRVRSAAHDWIMDEPRNLGGGNLGPTPFDMLQASLAACTSMTIRMYADRKDWPVEAVNTRVKIKHIKRTDTSIKTHEFIREIKLTGNLSEDQQQRILEIANKCPIHRLLEGNISTESYLST